MKIKFSSLVAVLALIIVGPGVAHASVDITDITIAIPNGINLSVVGFAQVDSFSVNSGSITFGLSPRQSVTLRSTDRYTLTNSLNAIQSCSSSYSQVELALESSSATQNVTITPSTSLCVAGGGGGGGGGGSISFSGGGGSSGGSSASASAPAPATPTVSPSPVALTATASVAPSATAVAVSPVFARPLKLGATSSDVKRLQQLLNSDPATRVSNSGLGAPGNETDFYGSATRSAVRKFQLKHGVVKSSKDAGYGELGPKTRAKFAELFGSVPASVPAAIPAQDSVKMQSLLDQLKVLQEQLLKLKSSQ